MLKANDNEYSLLHDIFYTTDEVINKYGKEYSFFISDTLLVKSESIYQSYMLKDPLTLVKNNETKIIGKDFLIDLIDDKSLYKYILNHMDNPHGIALKVAVFRDGRITKTLTLTRADLTELLNKIDASDLSPTQQMRRSLINSLSTDLSLRQKYNDQYHKCNIDGEDIEISVNTLLGLLSLSDEEFLQFQNGIKKYDYSKEIMAYMLVDFMERERILAKYVLPNNQKDRFSLIEKYKLIDYEYINKNQKSNDYDQYGESVLEQFTIDQDLYNEIRNSIPEDYSVLEQAMHIYLKMCELLTYDQTFYASNQKGKTINEHEDLSNINYITKENNIVVSYEFIMMYAKFLKELGIKFTLNSTLGVGYGKGHASLTFRLAEFIVSVDSSNNILANDMANVKINASIIGFKCINTNQVTKNKFDELFYRIISNYINTKEDKKLFSDYVEEYKEKYAHYTLDTREKLQIILKNFAREDLKGMDAVTYQKKIFDNVFREHTNVSINFISSMINDYSDSLYSPITIISILTHQGYKYLVIDPNALDVIESIEREELEEMFESGYYAYIHSADRKIPGLLLEGAKFYVR